MFVEQRLFCLLHLGCLLLVRDSSRIIFQIPSLSVHVCIGKHNVGRQVCQHFGLIGFTTTKFYSDIFSTKKHSLDYYHCIIWLYYCLALLYINAPCTHPMVYLINLKGTWQCASSNHKCTGRLLLVLCYTRQEHVELEKQDVTCITMYSVFTVLLLTW